MLLMWPSLKDHIHLKHRTKMWWNENDILLTKGQLQEVLPYWALLGWLISDNAWYLFHPDSQGFTDPFGVFIRKLWDLLLTECPYETLYKSPCLRSSPYGFSFQPFELKNKLVNFMSY